MTHLPPDPPLNPHPRKAAPESVLAAPRNPVTRWNRKYLIAGATGLAGIVALGFYLGFGGAHAPQARPEAMTDTADTGQVFTPTASARAFELSGGHPWLVNALAKEVVEELVEDPARAITDADIDAALNKAKEAYVAGNPKSLGRYVEATAVMPG